MEKEFDIEDFIQDMIRDTPQKQQTEVKTWERVFESCKEFVDKYEKELNAKDKPVLERLFVMQEIINTYIQLFTKRNQPYQFDYNMIQLPNSGNAVERYTKWKNELLDINLSNCNTILKRIDTRIERLKSTLSPSTIPAVNDNQTTLERIKESCQLLYKDRIKWIGNQEQKKPLKEFFSPQLIAFIGEDASNCQSIAKQLESELEQDVKGVKEFEFIKAWATDYREILCSVTTMVGANYSLLGVFQTYNDHALHRQEKYNEIQAKKETREAEENALFITDYETFCDVSKALYKWAEVLINYIRKYTPALYNEHEQQFTEVLGYTKPIIPPPSTLPPASNSNTIPTPTIYILPDARPALVDAFIPYVDPSQHGSLKDLINKGLEPQQPIICNCQQVKIGRIFYELVKSDAQSDRQIQADKTVLANWICQCFERKERGIVKKLSESTMLNYLKGKRFAQYQ